MKSTASSLVSPPEKATSSQQWPGHMNVEGVATSGPEPKATLTASAQSLELNGTLGKFTFSPQTVERLHRARLYPWIFAGFRIRHRVAGYPKLIQFCPMMGTRSREILATLKSLGYAAS